MAIGIFLLAFCLLLGGLALRFAVPRAKTTRAQRALAALFAALMVLASLDAAMAWFGRRALVATLEVVPLRTAAAVAETTVGTEVLVVGRLPADAAGDGGEPGARYRCDPYCQYSGPAPLPIAVEGSVVAIVNGDYETREWSVERRTDDDYSTVLAPGAPVVAIGSIARAATATMPPSEPTAAPLGNSNAPKGNAIATAEMTALVVFAGSYDEFAERAEQRLLIATALLALSAIAALLAAAVAASLMLRRGAEERGAGGPFA